MTTTRPKNAECTCRQLGVAPRPASTSTATLFTGANVSATRHAKIRREKLSITACRYTRVPSSRRITVVSMCHISSARVVRRPTVGFAGCTRSLGRRQWNLRTRRYQVAGEAQTLPNRCARTASVPVGTCRYSGAVTMSSIVRISDGVSRWGDLSGQDDWSSSAHAAAAVARHGTDSATRAGTAGAPAPAQTLGPDPRRAGSGSWRVRLANARASM